MGEVSLEHIYDNIMDLRRDLGGTNEAIGGLREAVRGIDEKAERIETRVNEINGAVKDQGQRVATLEGIETGERKATQSEGGFWRREYAKTLGVILGILGAVASAYLAGSGRMPF